MNDAKCQNTENKKGIKQNRLTREIGFIEG